MVVSVRSLGLNGISGYEVGAECFLSGGLPAFDVVGLPDAAVREARERVRAAVKNCGVKFPVSRITVNLAPAGRKKAGTVYDLPIFVGLLAAAGELPPPPGDAAFVGELSLTGAVRGVHGVLPMAMKAREIGHPGRRPDGLRRGGRPVSGGPPAGAGAPLPRAGVGAGRGRDRPAGPGGRDGPGEREAGPGDRRRRRT